jgi:hypothetical protein
LAQCVLHIDGVKAACRISAQPTASARHEETGTWSATHRSRFAAAIEENAATNAQKLSSFDAYKPETVFPKVRCQISQYFNALKEKFVRSKKVLDTNSVLFHI